LTYLFLSRSLNIDTRLCYSSWSLHICASHQPERWLPLKQRASYIASLSKKKGGKESMGTGFTQGSTHSASGGGGGGGGGGGKGKKGKKK
jgi:hypothetical protein